MFETLNRLQKKSDESLAKPKHWNCEIEASLEAVSVMIIMSIFTNPSVVESPNLQTELDRIKYVPTKLERAVREQIRITVITPHVVTKKDVDSDSNGLSSTGVDNTAKTRRPQPKSNTENDRVPSASKSSCSKNQEVEVEEHPRNLLLSKNKKHMSSKCNHVKLAIRNAKSEIVCVMCKQCLVTANHDVCVLNYVNNMNSRADNQSANVSIRKNQKKHKANAKKSKELGSKGSLASSRPSKPRTCLRWIPTGRIFAMCGKLTASVHKNNLKICRCNMQSNIKSLEPQAKGIPKPTEKHLKEVKRIFSYLWGTVNMGLWYTKDSGFELTEFLDADDAGCTDTFKSTFGGAQFLGKKLVSWSSKKQDCMVLSTAEA
ncbi:retrovirus-related pol polyprotein from transposon TNT 1-94 [Tanacetum coccineum]